MRPLVSNRESLAINAETTIYRGSVHSMSIELIEQALEELTPSRPMTSFFAPGGVIRDKKKTAAWMIWNSKFEEGEISAEDRKSFFLECKLLRDIYGSTINIIYNLRPNQGSGGILYRCYITRLSIDDYLCFEY